MVGRICVVVLAVCLGAVIAEPASAANGELKTRVVILGVDHSAQLVSPANEPGMLTAFIEKLRPDAICIERPPELAERRDFYEFTYEVQGIVIPYAAAHPVDICPVDWIPPIDDQKLVFGSDLDEPPEFRPTTGFQTFMSFPDPKTLTEDIFAADDPVMTDPILKHADTPASHADQDFPRRLYLYRTFMQSQHIRAVAKAHNGRTVLVVIGYFHKPDLERVLSQDSSIDLVKPSTLGHPTRQQADAAMSREQRVAILSFNLLGAQSRTKNVDWAWMKAVLTALDPSTASAEGTLFRIRLDELTAKAPATNLVARLRALVRDAPADVAFSWTGVKDKARVDSYFDPFGNLTVRQRAAVELARLLRSQGSGAEAGGLLDQVKHEIGERKARQLDAYVTEYMPLEKAPG